MGRVMFLLLEGHIKKRQGRRMKVSLCHLRTGAVSVEPGQLNTDKNG